MEGTDFIKRKHLPSHLAAIVHGDTHAVVDLFPLAAYSRLEVSMALTYEVLLCIGLASEHIEGKKTTGNIPFSPACSPSLLSVRTNAT